MTVYHIVQFQFKALVPPDEDKAACQRVLDLETNCLHPASQKPYVKVLGGGKDNSLEGQQHGMTHAFILQFENEDDRRYHVEKDPAQLEFAASIRDILEEVQVIDFTPGVF
ncbi:dabb-domain-containing protein [Annulohypoxylon maeteangense]|uniref:dabb-domain-containing protein n=1 Tax=Annulohypoxylon maeteangense TaxID=1927788 RepID=UPI002008E895|nr:dabb-domain-containing protein [Annulohypoxylon maeteangense]KAI0880472.1 dabb-domain-containing protein [Annulohypoxylon maeteangense]